MVFMIPILSVIGLLSMDPIRADQESGTAIPAESRPCVDCHAFEFMQRALQDLKKTAYNLDMRGLSQKVQGGGSGAWHSRSVGWEGSFNY
ncbi:hypothetical protein Y1Q_0021335 [Alligator mississippiensis]|uniref:NELL2-interacting cell ontogeny regulator 1 n=1 Tax=Alligator mississippiensis TaxID=8496 RepID=A0A151P981_ALLMI|nr:hypothetical protein Y1Q_0021335 [Alligator mississippiensis]